MQHAKHLLFFSSGLGIVQTCEKRFIFLFSVVLELYQHGLLFLLLLIGEYLDDILSTELLIISVKYFYIDFYPVHDLLASADGAVYMLLIGPFYL